MDQNTNPEPLKLEDLTFVRRDGKHNTKYRCPFCEGHNFSVKNDNGLYYCFNCGRTGRVLLTKESDTSESYRPTSSGRNPIDHKPRHHAAGKSAARPIDRQDHVPSILESSTPMSSIPMSSTPNALNPNVLNPKCPREARC